MPIKLTSSKSDNAAANSLPGVTDKQEEWRPVHTKGLQDIAIGMPEVCSKKRLHQLQQLQSQCITLTTPTANALGVPRSY